MPNVAWMVYTCISSSFDAISDTISDEVLGEGTEDKDEDSESDDAVSGLSKSQAHIFDSGSIYAQDASSEDCHSGSYNTSASTFDLRLSKKPRRVREVKLTGEQDFIISSFLSLFLSAWLSFHTEGSVAETVGTPGFNLAVLAGVMYAVGSIACMKAWETLPSSVMVPLMQLASLLVEGMQLVLSRFHTVHWLLAPFNTQGVSTRVDFLAYILICAGALLPSIRVPTVSKVISAEPVCVKGEIFEGDVSLALLANVCFAVYVLLTVAATSDTLGPSMSISSMQFVMIANTAAFVFVVLGCTFNTKMYRAYRQLGLASPRCVILCSFSELANYIAGLTFTVAIRYYPNEGLLTASRAGLHQLFNFGLCIVLFALFRFGRKPENLMKKFVSSLLVLAGLLLSAPESETNLVK
eukprot:m.240760 g.240760  ORF g.240760 m.240760 type:complete len:410 (-) comp33768_c1_seq1:279-1508(-)